MRPLSNQSARTLSPQGVAVAVAGSASATNVAATTPSSAASASTRRCWGGEVAFTGRAGKAWLVGRVFRLLVSSMCAEGKRCVRRSGFYRVRERANAAGDGSVAAHGSGAGAVPPGAASALRGGSAPRCARRSRRPLRRFRRGRIGRRRHPAGGGGGRRPARDRARRGGLRLVGSATSPFVGSGARRGHAPSGRV